MNIKHNFSGFLDLLDEDESRPVSVAGTQAEANFVDEEQHRKSMYRPSPLFFTGSRKHDGHSTKGN